MLLERITSPIVQAPLAGGASTPALAAAVSGAGALGVVAGGYKSVEALKADVDAVRALTSRPFAVNVFCPPGGPGDPAAVERYAARLRASGVPDDALGAPRRDDDAYADKVAALVADPVAAVSFTFGLPSSEVMAALHRAGSEVWVTVNHPREAAQAAGAGADVLVVQGAEAGGHRGGWSDENGAEALGLLAALQLIGAATDVPLVATGGIATGAGVAAVLAAGARAAQLGTAFMRCPEAGTAPVHRRALDADAPTALTRAFTGRTARGVVNRFMAEHGDAAPAAYPEIHHLTAPLRARARAQEDAETLHLWAAQAHALGEALPAAELVRRLSEDARAALAVAARRVG